MEKISKQNRRDNPQVTCADIQALSGNVALGFPKWSKKIKNLELTSQLHNSFFIVPWIKNDVESSHFIRAKRGRKAWAELGIVFAKKTVQRRR